MHPLIHAVYRTYLLLSTYFSGGGGGGEELYYIVLGFRICLGKKKKSRSIFLIFFQYLDKYFFSRQVFASKLF